MHHFRGKLLDGDRTRLDPANVYIQSHSTASGPLPGWHGYLLIPSDAGLEPGDTYTLTLADGRSGNLRIASLEPDDGKTRAIFVVEGPLA